MEGAGNVQDQPLYFDLVVSGGSGPKAYVYKIKNDKDEVDVGAVVVDGQLQVTTIGTYNLTITNPASADYLEEIAVFTIKVQEKSSGGGSSSGSSTISKEDLFWRKVKSELDVNNEITVYARADKYSKVSKYILQAHQDRNKEFVLSLSDGTINITPEMADSVIYSKSKYNIEELNNLFNIIEIEPTPMPEPTPETVPAPTVKPDGETEGSGNAVVVGICLLGLIVLILLCVILIKSLANKKK